VQLGTDSEIKGMSNARKQEGDVKFIGGMGFHIATWRRWGRSLREDRPNWVE
jgi:hypothetical protein